MKKRLTNAEETLKKRWRNSEETPKKRRRNAEETPKKRWRTAEETLKKRFLWPKSATSTKKFPMSESRCKTILLMHSGHGQAPVRWTFLRSVRWSALQCGKLLGVSNQSFQMIWIIEKCRRSGFISSWRKIRKQTVLRCAKDYWHDIEQRNDFLWHVVICDETWVHHHIPESKQESM